MRRGNGGDSGEPDLWSVVDRLSEAISHLITVSRALDLRLDAVEAYLREQPSFEPIRYAAIVNGLKREASERKAKQGAAKPKRPKPTTLSRKKTALRIVRAIEDLD
jgi:hypothetical protein